MIIKIRQSGGFAGLTRNLEVNTDSMTNSEASKIKSLVKKSQLEIPRLSKLNKKTTKGAADCFVYEISILEDGKEKHMECSQLDVDFTTKNLIDYLFKNWSR